MCPETACPYTLRAEPRMSKDSGRVKGYRMRVAIRHVTVAGWSFDVQKSPF